MKGYVFSKMGVFIWCRFFHPFAMKPRSVQTLHDWGNTSSSSIWYETDWIERFGVSLRHDKNVCTDCDVLFQNFGSGKWLELKGNVILERGPKFHVHEVYLILEGYS